MGHSPLVQVWKEKKKKKGKINQPTYRIVMENNSPLSPDGTNPKCEAAHKWQH